MKKLFVLSIMFALSGCACMNSDEPEEQVVYKSSNSVVAANAADMNCDYIEGNTCYRYVRRQRQVEYVRPAPEVVRYREPSSSYRYVRSTCRSCDTCNTPAASGDCAPKIRTTREPVEIVYRKTTYKTVYEPKTTSSVSYEKVPYAQNRSDQDYVEVNNNEELIVE